MKQYFELKDGSHQKFWAIEQVGSVVTVHFGRIGTAGQTKSKSSATPEEARRAAAKLVASKTAKGYSKAGHGKPENLSFPEFMNWLEQQLASTRRGYLKLSAKRRKNLSPWASKGRDEGSSRGSRGPLRQCRYGYQSF